MHRIFPSSYGWHLILSKDNQTLKAIQEKVLPLLVLQLEQWCHVKKRKRMADILWVSIFNLQGKYQWTCGSKRMFGTCLLLSLIYSLIQKRHTCFCVRISRQSVLIYSWCTARTDLSTNEFLTMRQCFKDNPKVFCFLSVNKFSPLKDMTWIFITFQNFKNKNYKRSKNHYFYFFFYWSHIHPSPNIKIYVGKNTTLCSLILFKS